ncbi:hybrid sensor histidine kinase/response regulator [Polaromonas sp. P2-4]|nr:hybrid sensor histidine kinase/response regulator [Polaromonas sp. P2-4]
MLIDDMPAIHEDFRKILVARPAARELDDVEAVLFGQAVPPPCGGFELDSAYQGPEGLAKVEASIQAGRPYAMAFVDMRMPPGWDGAETIERLWRVDPQMQIVICTAYSDRTWEKVLARLDVQDRLLILKKPFDMIEISQLARTLTAKWEMARQAALQMNSLEEAVEELTATKTALYQSNKELEAFSYSVAHDLRSPLKSIDGFSHLLQKAISGDTADRSMHYLDRIRAGVRQMSELTDGLLSLAQVSHTHLKAEPVDLTAMAEQVLHDCQERDSGRTVQVHVERDLTAIGDPALLRQVMENLLANAWKFTANIATPEIEVGQLHGNNETAVFFVRDNGAGFDMAYADKLFGTFQRLHTSEEFAGTGIGLATSHRIISRHAGRIWAEGAVGQGATFFFTIPPASRQHLPSESCIDSQENRRAP